MRCLICDAEIDDQAPYCPACGSITTRFGPEGDPETERLLGELVAGRFRLDAILGIGGMGKVFRATDLSAIPEEVVVVKVLHEHLAEDHKLVLRFRREWRAARRLDHPNIIRVLDFGEDEQDRVYIAMEYVEGRDLTVLLDPAQARGEAWLARMALEVCSALEHAHRRQVIHRDLKPENIRLAPRPDGSETVKILDFGIAKIQDPDDKTGVTLTRAGEAFGTFEYMSPEQARAERPPDPRSDLYQLGVMLYELTTGQLPFRDDKPFDLLERVKHELPIRPTVRAPDRDISPEMEAVILRAMAKDKDARYPDAGAMARDLRRLVPGGGLRSFLRFRPVRWAALVLLAGAAAIAAFLSVDWLGSRNPFEAVHAALAADKPATALDLLADLSARKTPEGQALKARALLRLLRPKRTRASALLCSAIQQDEALLDDPQVRRDLVTSLGRKRAGKTIRYLTESFGQRLLPELEAATRSERYFERWNSIELLEKLGAGERVDRVAAYLLDLEHARTCKTRRNAAEQLGELGDPRAAGALAAALERPPKENACMEGTLERALLQIGLKQKQGR